jgi:hypothetical protein
MISSILRNWQVMILAFFIIIAVLLIAPWGQPGIYVKYVDPSSPLFGSIEPGDIIYKIKPIRTIVT